MARPDTIRVIAWPTLEPVSLAEVKHQLGMMADQDEHDMFLLAKIAAGRRYIEQRLGKALMAQQVRATWKVAGRVCHIPVPPLLVDEEHELVVTADGVAVSSQDYDLDQDAVPATIESSKWVGQKVVAEYWAGAATMAEVPPQLRGALLVWVEHAFMNRGVMAENGTTELPHAFEALLASESYSGGY